MGIYPLGETDKLLFFFYHEKMKLKQQQWRYNKDIINVGKTIRSHHPNNHR